MPAATEALLIGLLTTILVGVAVLIVLILLLWRVLRLIRLNVPALPPAVPPETPADSASALPVVPGAVPSPAQIAALVTEQVETQVTAQVVLQLSSIRTAAASLAGPLELQPLLDLMARQAVALVGAAGASIYLTEDADTVLRLAVAFGDGSHHAPAVETPFSQTGLAARAATIRRALNVRDYSEWSGRLPIDESSSIRAAVALPLLLNEKLLGVLIVYEQEPERFYSDIDIAKLETFVQQAVLALNNARINHVLQAVQGTLTDQIDELTMFQRIDQELSATLNLDSVLTLTVDWALRRTRARAGTVSIATIDGAGLIPFTTLGYPSGALPYSLERPAPLSWGLTGRAARTRQTVLALDVEQEPDYAAVLPGIRAQIAVPMEVQGRLLGVLSIESDRPETFNPELYEFITRLSARAAIALDNARLYRESVRLADDLAALYTAGRVISASLERAEILSQTAQSGAALLNASSAVVLDYHLGQASMTILSAYKLGTAPDAVEALPLVGEGWPLGSLPEVAEALSQLRAIGLRRSETLTASTQQWFDELHVFAIAFTPLIIQGELIGALLILESRHERTFTRDDLMLCESLASQAAGTLRQAQLYDEVRELEGLKSEMIRMASHDLRNPIGNVLGYLELLTHYAQPVMTKEFQLCIDNIRVAARSMKSLVDDLLSLERIDSERQTAWVTFDLGALVQEVHELQQASAGLKHQSLLLERPAEAVLVLGSSTQMRQAVANLVSNASKYTRDEGRIVVRLREEAGRVTFEVEDNGLGIPQDRQTRLFQRFYRAKQPGTDNIPGTGLGLSLVKTVINRHGGDVWVRSVSGVGSTFGFWLPKAPHEVVPQRLIASLGES